MLLDNPRFDTLTKRKVLALLIVLLTSAWTPIVRDLFLNVMNTEFLPGITVGLIVSIFALIGAWQLYKMGWF